MSFELKISAEADKESIFVYDKTGKSSDCDSGWGDPNLRLTDISEAYLLISGPDISAPILLDLMPVFPNDQGIGYEILAEDLGLKKIKSGKWSIEYVVVYSPAGQDKETFRTKCYYFFDDDVKCCVQNKVLSTDMTNINTPEAKAAIDASLMLESAQKAAENGQVSAFEKIIAMLNNQCDCCL